MPLSGSWLGPLKLHLVAPKIAVYFQHFPLAPKTSVQLVCNQMTRRFVMYRLHGSKRPVGKPPTKARLRRDQIADLLLELRRTEPKMDACINAVAHHFGVHPQTAWNAWAECKPFVVEAIGKRFECVPYGKPIIFDLGEPLFTLSTLSPK
jgi:hypothetical protein